jgi:hypothetical protein
MLIHSHRFLGAASDAVHRYTVAVFAAHLSGAKSNDAGEHSQARINSPADDSEACYDFRSESATLHRSMREQHRHRARGVDVEAAVRESISCKRVENSCHGNST